MHEDAVIARLLEAHGVQGQGLAVDIAACDGVSGSNTLALYEQHWHGLAVEGSPAAFRRLAQTFERFPSVGLARVWVTPENVLDLLRAHDVRRQFEFLSLDIDGYDHFVLDAILLAFRPLLICAEINEKIPPPVRFTVRYDPAYVWAEDHFYGQSIVALHELAERHGYALVELHYNNAFLVPKERCVLPALSAADAYQTGYLDLPDRLTHFPWNANMEPLHALDTEQKLEFLRSHFAAYEGKYDLSA